MGAAHDLIDNPATDHSSDEQSAPAVDGRSQRRIRNRTACIHALIELVAEGDLNPTVPKIAERAGVSDRSIFRYFTDLADLSLAAVDSELRAVIPLMLIPDIGVGSLDDRIAELVSSRLRTYARTHTLGRVARSKSVVIPEIDDGLAQILAIGRHQIDRQFEAELQSQESGAESANAIAVMLSWESYDLLTRQFGLRVDEVEAIWSTAVHALVTG